MEKIEENLLLEIKKYFLENKNEESCGLILKDDNGLNFYRTKNIANLKKDNFIIDSEDYIQAKKNGEIIWYCHSHIKDRSFSIQDVRNSLNHKINHLLYNIQRDKFYFLFTEKFLKYKKYLDKDFIIGKNDCSTLISLFYNQELNHDFKIQPPHLNKDISYDDIKKDNKHIWSIQDYKENTKDFVIFHPKSYEELEENDIIVFKDKHDLPTHGAIYLGQELILHQRLDSKSLIEGLRKAHVRYIKYVARKIK